jgi:hypothetical protein
MNKRERDVLAGRGVFLPPSSARDVRTKAPDEQGLSRMKPSNVLAQAHVGIEQQLAADARGYGGRRLGLNIDKAEQAKREAIERRLLDVARRVIEKDR